MSSNSSLDTANDLEIPEKDIEILTADYEQEIRELKAKRAKFTIRINKINKQIAQYESELEYLGQCKNAGDWSATALVDPDGQVSQKKRDIIGTLTLRLLKLKNKSK